MEEVLRLITQNLKTMVEASNPRRIFIKRKAITVLFLYSVQHNWGGQQEILKLVFHAAGGSRNWWGFMWHCISPAVAMMLDEGSPVPLKQAALLALPHLPWWRFTGDEQLVQLWARAASEVPDTDEICQSVVNTLLQVASNDHLQPHIPTGMWSWLNRRPPLPPVCAGWWGTSQDIVQTIRELQDNETLTSYLLSVWSEWGYINSEGHHEMCASIREDLSGPRMGYRRKELLLHLDYIQSQLDLGLEHLQQNKPDLRRHDVWGITQQYMIFKKVLLEVEKEAVDMLVCESPLQAYSPLIC